MCTFTDAPLADAPPFAGTAPVPSPAFMAKLDILRYPDPGCTPARLSPVVDERIRRLVDMEG